MGVSARGMDIRDWLPKPVAATLIVSAVDSLHPERADFHCTGVNDELVIQAAITALPAAGGKIVLLDGNYSISAVITINKQLTLEGQAAESTVLNNINAAGANLLNVTGGPKAPRVIRNLTLSGNVASGHGLYCDTWYLTVENCKIDSHGGYGLYFAGPTHYHEILNSYIQENATGGVYMESANFNTFLNCKFDLNLNYAVNIQAGGSGTIDVSFKHCSFETQPQMAVNLNGVSNILFETCWFENNTTASGNEDILITGCQLVTFRDCALTPGASSLEIFHLDNSREVRVEKNKIFGSGEYAILVDSDCGRNYFTSNYVDNIRIDDRSYRLVVKDIRMHTDGLRYLGFPASESMGYFKATIDNLNIRNMAAHSSQEDAHRLVAGGANPPAVAWEKNDGWYDKYSGKITFAAGCGAGVANSEAHRALANVTINKYYLATFMLRASISTVALEAGIIGAASMGYLKINEPPTDWKKFVIMCQKAGGSGLNQWQIYPEVNPGANIDVYVDDFQLIEFDNWEDMTRVANFAITNYLPSIEALTTRKPAVSETEGIFNYAFEERGAIADILEILGDVRGLWPFKAPYHTVVEDFSRRNHDMTPSEDCRNWDTPPRFRGKATIFTFNGTDEEMDVVSHADFLFGNAAGNDDSPFSIICVIRPAADTYPYTLIGKYNEATPAREWIFRLDANGRPEFELHDESVPAYIGREHTVAVTVDVLTILIVTYDGSETSAGVKIYKDGVRVDNANHAAGAYVGMEQLGAKVTIGYNVVGGPANGNFLKGGATWFGITGKELSADECWTVYQRLLGLLGI